MTASVNTNGHTSLWFVVVARNIRVHPPKLITVVRPAEKALVRMSRICKRQTIEVWEGLEGSFGAGCGRYMTQRLNHTRLERPLVTFSLF
jgi:hypothetical protein